MMGGPMGTAPYGQFGTNAQFGGAPFPGQFGTNMYPGAGGFGPGQMGMGGAGAFPTNTNSLFGGPQ
jgi:hypothetical protein